MYTYLLWDIDGTVLDFLASEARAIRRLFEEYGLGECTDEMLKVYSSINARYWEALERGERTRPEILVARFRDFFDSVGIDIRLAEEFNGAYQLALGDHCVFVPHAREVLESEKGRRVLAAVTNGTRVAQRKKLRQTGLDRLFDFVFISEDVGYEKPQAPYFDYVLREIGAGDRRDVLLIGDSLTSDMLGGANAGIDTCWYNPGRAANTKGVPVTYEIADLREVERILRETEKCFT